MLRNSLALGANLTDRHVNELFPTRQSPEVAEMLAEPWPTEAQVSQFRGLSGQEALDEVRF